MTPTPKTVSLNPSEWKALLVANAADMHAGFTALACPSPSELQAIDEHLDRMKALVLAWHRSAPAPAPVRNVTEEENWLADAALIAGTELVGEIKKPKRKPGWPKGRKRGPRKVKNGN